MKQEVKELMELSKKKPWKEKEEWEKFLDRDRVRQYKKRKSKEKHEVLMEPYHFEKRVFC